MDWPDGLADVAWNASKVHPLPYAVGAVRKCFIIKGALDVPKAVVLVL